MSKFFVDTLDMEQKISNMADIATDGMKKIRNFGVGVDIENIDRFRKIDIIKDSLFLRRIFTKNELDYCFSKKTPASYLAVRYAGKEAIVKALTSIGKLNIDYKELEIFNNENRVPVVRINNKDLHKLHVLLSLSHSKDQAIAFATVMEIDNYEQD